MEALTAILENWDADTSGSPGQTGLVGGLIEGYVREVGLGGVVGGTGGGGGGGGGGAGAGREKERQADEEELSELSWKVGRLAEMFLSKEMQV